MSEVIEKIPFDAPQHLQRANRIAELALEHDGIKHKFGSKLLAMRERQKFYQAKIIAKRKYPASRFALMQVETTLWKDADGGYTWTIGAANQLNIDLEFETLKGQKLTSADYREIGTQEYEKNKEDYLLNIEIELRTKYRIPPGPCPPHIYTKSQALLSKGYLAVEDRGPDYAGPMEMPT